jgi:hypothetical protein
LAPTTSGGFWGRVRDDRRRTERRSPQNRCAPEGGTQPSQRLTARALRLGLRERDASDLVHALMSPELDRLLVIDRGRPPRRYDQWLTRILGDQLTAPSPRFGPRDALPVDGGDVEDHFGVRTHRRAGNRGRRYC